jgi:hypothetical protein
MPSHATRENSSGVTSLAAAVPVPCVSGVRGVVNESLSKDKSWRCAVAYPCGWISLVAADKPPSSLDNAVPGDGPEEALPSPGPGVDVPDLDLRPRGKPAPKPKPKPSLRVPEPRASTSRAPAPHVSETPSDSDVGFDDTILAAPRIEVDAPLTPAIRAPARATPMRRDDPSAFAPSPERRRSWGTFAFLLFLFLFGTAAAAAYEAPFYVKGRIAEVASRSGLMVAVGDIVFRPRELLLKETKIAVPELEGVTVTVGEVEVAFEGLEPRGISIRGFDISLTGSFVETYGRVEKWARSLPAPLRVEARAGHVHWSNPWGAGTELEATDVTLSTVKGVSLTSPSILVGVPSTKIGPWKLKLEQKSGETHVAVGLDPASPASRLALNAGKDGHVTVALDVPLSPLSRIGIPPEPLGLAVDPYLELHMSLDAAEPPTVTGKLALTLSSLRPPPPPKAAAKVAAGSPAQPHAPDPSGAPTDVQLMTALSGRLGEPIALADGLVSFGPTKGKVTGTLLFGDSAIRANLAFQWPSAGQHVLPAVFALDTRDAWGTGRP